VRLTCASCGTITSRSRWVWLSIRPGRRVAAPRSTTWTPAAAFARTCAGAPICVILPFSTSTAAGASAFPVRGSISRAAVTRVADAEDCAPAGTAASSRRSRCTSEEVRIPGERRCQSYGHCSSIYLWCSKYEAHASFQGGGPNPRAVLEARDVLGTRDPRQPAGRGTRRLHDSADAGLPARAGRGAAQVQDERDRAAFRAGNRPARVPQRAGARPAGALRRLATAARLKPARDGYHYAQRSKGPSGGAASGGREARARQGACLMHEHIAPA